MYYPKRNYIGALGACTSSKRPDSEPEAGLGAAGAAGKHAALLPDRVQPQSDDGLRKLQLGVHLADVIKPRFQEEYSRGTGEVRNQMRQQLGCTWAHRSSWSARCHTVVPKYLDLPM